MPKQRRSRKKPKRGGYRPGAGRPPMFEGDRVKMTITVTDTAKKLVDRTVIALEPEHGAQATQSAAVEHLIRRATRTPLDA